MTKNIKTETKIPLPDYCDSLSDGWGKITRCKFKSNFTLNDRPDVFVIILLILSNLLSKFVLLISFICLHFWCIDVLVGSIVCNFNYSTCILFQEISYPKMQIWFHQYHDRINHDWVNKILHHNGWEYYVTIDQYTLIFNLPHCVTFFLVLPPLPLW